MALDGSTLLLCAVIIVPLGLFLGWRMRVKQHARRRRVEWLDLCRRLELSPREERPEVASGRQHGAELELRDTGSVLFLGLRLSESLLPPGVLLLSAQALDLSGATPRPLRLRDRAARPGAPGWYAASEGTAGDVEVSQAFLDEAEHAAQAHTALGLEAEWLFQALPAAALPDPREVRDAVLALQLTADRWLEVVKAHGLPRLGSSPLPSPEPTPRAPAGPVPVHVFEPGVRASSSPEPQRSSPVPTRPQRSLAFKGPWFWLLCINGGTPIAVLALKWQWEWLFWLAGAAHLLGLVIAGSQRSRKDLHYLVVLIFPAVFASYLTPLAWDQNQKLRDCPHAEGLSVRDAPGSFQACWFRFRDGAVRDDLGGMVSIESKDRKGRIRWNNYHAYPIVPEGWTPQEPVTAWSTTPPQPGPLQGFGISGSLPLANAANAAADKHGLLNHPKAVYLSLSPSMTWEQDLERREHEARLMWAGPNVLWLLAALVFWGRAFWRRSPP
jgi:hypothetical protein